MKFGVDIMPLGIYPKIELFKFVQLVIPTWRAKITCEVVSTLVPLAIGPYNDVRL
jgi:hypothetical protein